MQRPTPRQAGLALALALAACGDPCRELSEKVCSCELELAARRRCEQKVGVRASLFSPPADKDENARGQRACAELLDGCTCARLRAGDLVACGLAKPQAS